MVGPQGADRLEGAGKFGSFGVKSSDFGGGGVASAAGLTPLYFAREVRLLSCAATLCGSAGSGGATRG